MQPNKFSFKALIPWLLLVVLAAAAGGGWWWYQAYQAAQQKQAELAALRTESIVRGNITAKVSATGSIQPEQQSNLFFLSTGTVAEVKVASGDVVKAGQVLARLDTTTLALAVRQAEDALAVAQLNRDKLLAGPSDDDIAVAKANLRSANAQLADLLKGGDDEDVKIAQLKYDGLATDYQKAQERYNSLLQLAKDYPQFAPSQYQLDSAKASVEMAFYAAETARVQVDQVKAGGGPGPTAIAYAQVAQAQAIVSQTLAAPSPVQLDRAVLAIDQAQTALDLAKLRLARAELRAPFAGVVAVVNLTVGEPATAGTTPAVVLIDAQQFHLDVTVDEVDIAQLKVGQVVSVTLDALPDVQLSGRVDRLAPTANVVGGLVSYAVRLVLDPTEAPLRAGMSATAEIVVAEAAEVVLVPNWAIRRDRRTGQAYASLKVGEQLQEVPIETGLRGDSYTEVTAGVKEGDVAAITTTQNTLDFLGGE